MVKHNFHWNGLDIKANCSIFFQAEDYQGNIIGSNSLSIGGINSLLFDNFIVDFSKNGATAFDFVCKYSNISYQPYYNIYLNFVPKNNTFNEFEFFDYSADSFVNSGLMYVSEKTEPILLNSGSLYRIRNSKYGLNDVSLDLVFSIYNKTTGQFCLSKSYNLLLSAASSELSNNNDNSSINGGVIVDSSGNSSSMDSSNDNNFIINNGSISNNINSAFGGNDWLENFGNAVSYCINFFESIPQIFECISYFFSCLPNYIIAPIIVGITLMLIISIIKLARG